jgi:hypothetical protein
MVAGLLNLAQTHRLHLLLHVDVDVDVRVDVRLVHQLISSSQRVLHPSRVTEVCLPRKVVVGEVVFWDSHSGRMGSRVLDFR